jgi:flagellin
MTSQIRGLNQAFRNANDGVSMSQVAEGGMNEMQGIVSRMRELAVQSANSTLGGTERGYIQTEFTQLQGEINRIGAVNEFNGQKLLDGSGSTGFTFQVGAQNTANDRLSMSITKLTTSTLGSTSLHLASASLSQASSAQKAIGAFDKAIQQLSSARAKVGAVQNRIDSAINNATVYIESLSSAESMIRDTDYATETANLTKLQIMQQAGSAMVAQANQLPNQVLALLR